MYLLQQQQQQQQQQQHQAGVTNELLCYHLVQCLLPSSSARFLHLAT